MEKEAYLQIKYKMKNYVNSCVNEFENSDEMDKFLWKASSGPRRIRKFE